MGETDHEPDPRRQVPTFLWMILALFLAALLAAILVLHGHPGGRSVYGPPAGAPEAH